MPPDRHTEIFETQRPRLLRLGYRMLGSRHDAEDVVQEAFLRWHHSDQGAVLEPAAWLTRVVSRLCLDQMKSARARREAYPGTWLPEPLIEPEEDAMRPDNLTLTLMMALERLSPLERAAFLLHDVFGQPLDEVATTIGRSPAATRQLASRARAHVKLDRPRQEIPRERRDSLARAFFDACLSGDAESLGAMLASDVSVQSDGGGKIRAFDIIRGSDRVRRLFQGITRKFGPIELLRMVSIDGLPGYLTRVGGILQTTALEFDGERIANIYITRNPDKLDGVALH
ncbi:sigma-70 family RNA polymerase sigma factor [Paracoccus sp. IB05]|uniref:sigma-70 family RNA polymerase sigma factor n=1 Tax=Paracoccus sp. IB05 TaxID=2779367 RepID=UPI0018E6EC6D|nr:sigma-70 family RNA polymerase sigma factor [Paracoccus sp. IB05]MBJ2149894.1 sigma-70 family RNA polymerase sigma factor [Paracoccus sp. IB05]